MEGNNKGRNRLGDETSSHSLEQCVMRRRTGTSANRTLPVHLMAVKSYRSTNRKLSFLSLCSRRPFRIFQTCFEGFSGKLNMFIPVDKLAYCSSCKVLKISVIGQSRKHVFPKITTIFL